MDYYGLTKRGLLWRACLPPQVVTAYRTSKIEKYWRDEA